MSLSDQPHGMLRYEFRDGKAVDFRCFCDAVFTDADQLGAHVEVARGNVYWIAQNEPVSSFDEAISSERAFEQWLTSRDGIGPEPEAGEKWETDAQNEWALREDAAALAWRAGVEWAIRHTTRSGSPPDDRCDAFASIIQSPEFRADLDAFQNGDNAAIEGAIGATCREFAEKAQ